MPYRSRADYNEYRRQWRAERSASRRPQPQPPVLTRRTVGLWPAQLVVLDRMAAEARLSRSTLVRQLIDEAILARTGCVHKDSTTTSV